VAVKTLLIDLHVQCIAENSDGLLDIDALEAALKLHSKAPLVLGSFTAGSNVTGIVNNIQKIAAVLHKYVSPRSFLHYLLLTCSSPSSRCRERAVPVSILMVHLTDIICIIYTIN
jgi:hypothetical protein